MQECKIPVLFEIMKERKIKAVELSRAVNVSTGNISDWKSGRAKPSSEKLIEIAQYLGVSADYLLGKTNQPDKQAKKETPIQSDERSGNDYVPLLQQFNLLPKDLQRQALNDMMQAYLDNPELLK